MKFSYKWLQELSGTKKGVQELVDMLIVHAFEVEDVIEQGNGLEHVVIGKVLTKEKHPDADRLNVATIDMGTEKLTIVCGAPNLAVGQHVVVARVGAVLPTEDGTGFTIKKSTIRGVESNGMICAEDELGVGSDHEGIMVLPDDAPVGESFATYYGCDDTILDIDILPNRAHDALGHMGMAREIAALEGRILKDAQDKGALQAIKEDTEGERIAVSLDTKNAERYIGMVFDHITLQPSPAWMQARLRACDITPINAIVDISNYVMLLYGQPTHAFDATTLADQKKPITIAVRQAQEDETMTLLDASQIQLSAQDVVITDGRVPIALAGVMGAEGSAISDATTSVIFEIAHFDAGTIRKTKSRHNLQTDAAYRFERDLDPNLALPAAETVAKLMEEILGQKPATYVDVYPRKQKPWRVRISHDAIERLLGLTIPQKTVETILTNLGITVSEKDHVYTCTIPTIRRDLRESADLVEEIGRIYGYDKIVPKPLTAHVQPSQKNLQRIFENRTKNYFAMQGFDEIKSYSFYSREDAKALGVDDEKHVMLLNPMSSAQALMRQTLLAGLLRAHTKNVAQQETTQLFEVGRIYATGGDQLPIEQTRLAASIASKADDGSAFFLLKGIVESYVEAVGLSGVYFDDVFGSDDADIVDLHPSRRALVKTRDGNVLGYIGEVAKKTVKSFGLKKLRVTACELNMDLLQSHAQHGETFASLPKFPAVTRDLSMKVDAYTRVADVERMLYDAGGKLLREVDLFDLYENTKTGERSMAFHFVFSSPKRTLTAKEIDAIIEKMIEAVEEDSTIEVKR